MPGEGRTFDARRILPHAAKDNQLAQIAADGRIGRQKVVELIHQLHSLFARFSLQAFGHERGRSGGDGAAGAFETGILDDVSIHLQIQLELIAAQRVIAFGLAVGVGERVMVPRAFAVVEDGLLVEVVNHSPNTSFTLYSPAASASISPRVL